VYSTNIFIFLAEGERGTAKLSKTKSGALPPRVLGGIIENQNSDFVMT
jgi:hypothetical protein